MINMNKTDVIIVGAGHNVEAHVARALTSRQCLGCRAQIRLWQPFRPAVGNSERTLSMGFPGQPGTWFVRFVLKSGTSGGDLETTMAG